MLYITWILVTNEVCVYPETCPAQHFHQLPGGDNVVPSTQVCESLL